MTSITARANKIAIVLDECYNLTGPCLRVEYRNNRDPVMVERFIMANLVQDRDNGEHWVIEDQRPGSGHSSKFGVVHTVKDAQDRIYERAVQLSRIIGGRYQMEVVDDFSIAR